jgi:hypothetical protein
MEYDAYQVAENFKNGQIGNTRRALDSMSGMEAIHFAFKMTEFMSQSEKESFWRWVSMY